MVWERFQIYGVQITRKYIYESKELEVEIFTHSPQDKLSFGSHHHPQAERGKLLFPPDGLFFKNQSPWQKG